MRSVIANFSEKLPEDESERREVLLDTAERVCEQKRRNFTEEVNLSAVEKDGKEAKKLARRLSYSSQIVNEQFTDDVPVSKFKRLRAGAGKATKYAPLLGSTERFMEASCAASESRNESSIEDFQVAAMMVGVDLVLAYSGVGYRPAFKGTRLAMNKASQVGFYRLRYVCGNRCWALAWSESYAISKSGIVTGVSLLIEEGAKAGVNLSEEDVAYVVDKQGLNESTAREVAGDIGEEGSRLGSEVSDTIDDCVSDANVSNVSDDPEKVVEGAEDVASGFLGDSENESESSGSTCSSSQSG